MANVAAVAVPALGALAFFLFAGKSKAAPGAAGAVKATAKPVAQRMAEAIATGNPAAIRALAAALRAEGNASSAGELDKVAAVLDAQRVGGQPGALPAPPATPASPSTVPVPGAPWLAGVPAELQGVVLRKVSPASYDPRVKVLQDRLVALGYKLDADGKFGAGTETAVKAFQTANGVVPSDGVVGADTLIALASSKAKGPLSAFVPVAKSPAAKPPATPKPPAATTAKPPTVVLPAGPAPSSAGRAPTITAALKSLPALLRKSADGKFVAPASKGAAVQDWQQVLFDLGFTTVKPDGKFGDATHVATKAFQAAANSAAAKSGKPLLDVDGVVGPASVRRAAEARIMPTGPASFTGDAWFGGDVMFAPSAPRPDSPLPGIIPLMAPVEPDPSRALAARLTHMLITAPRGREDRTLVALFQTREGLRPTGYYGPATALVLAQRYGIVPPKPVHWTDSRTSKSKANYRDALRLLGERDPQRVEEWQRAGEV